MESSGSFSSPRMDAFPAGLRVLVVDDDPTWLKILEKMLKKCSYEVTTCCLAREALDLLRERKDGFDIVISDVNMPDMDGFKLLEHLGLLMDLPVIMMSVDGETSRVMKGVQHGACDYLLKPIRMKELKNIWQHVFRKKIHEVRDIEGHEGLEDIQMMRNGSSDQLDDRYLLSGDDPTLGKKRKDIDNKHDDKDFGDSSSTKKARVVWTFDLHQKFVKAVNQSGVDKVGPKKILDLMNVPWLTRENVASHLQKYRLYLGRLQKENEVKVISGGTKYSDISSKDTTENLFIRTSINEQRDDACNPKCVIPANIVHVQNVNPKIHESGLKDIGSLPLTEPMKAQVGDIPEAQEASSSKVGFNHSYRSLEPDIDYSPFGSTVTTQYWNVEEPQVHFQHEHKPPLHVVHNFHHLQQPDLQHHIQVNNLQSTASITCRNFNEKIDKSGHTEIKPALPAKCSTSQQNRQIPPLDTLDIFGTQSEHQTKWSTKNQGLDQTSIRTLESVQENLILGRGSAVQSLDEELHSCLIQFNGSTANFGHQNNELLECNDPELVVDIPPYLYDALRFDYEYPCDSIEYPVIDQGLFIA